MLRLIEIQRGSDAQGALHTQHTLEAALDAYGHVGLPVDHLLPQDVLEWWRQRNVAH
jgi:hypothetical protein